MSATASDNLNELTEKIIGAALRVRKELGLGFAEKVYENAMVFELSDGGLFVEQQKPLQVTYRGMVVGEYVTDLLVDQKVIIEFKAARAIDPAHVAQCLNYLKATRLPVCLLMNFGDKFEFKRLVGQSYMS